MAGLSNRACNRRRIKRLKEQGLCPQCLNKARPNKVRCQKCADKEAILYQKRKKRYKIQR